MALADAVSAIRYEVLNALEKLKPYGATLDEAVSFFIKHAKPPKPAIPFQEAIDLFFSIKAKAGLSQRYLDAASDYFRVLRDHFKNCLVTEVDFKQAEAYIYDKRHQWNPTTIANHLRHARLLFNFLSERGYISSGLNPFAKVPKPKQVETAVTVLAAPEVAKFLQHAFDSGVTAECACMVLVFFCGIRVEEAEKLDWNHVNLIKKRVEVPASVAKKGRRRSNLLSANALSWLTICKGEGRIAPRNFSNRVRARRQEVGLHYPQNAARHSFASNHVAAFNNAAKTAMLLGHPNAVLLYNTYRDVVHHEDALRYWDIYPQGEIQKREIIISDIRNRLRGA